MYMRSDMKIGWWIRDSSVWCEYSNEPYDIVIISQIIVVNVLEQ